MKKSSNFNKAFELIETLSQEERDEIVRGIMTMFAKDKSCKEVARRSRTGCDSIVIEATPGRPNCPHCGAKSSLGFIVKKGMHNGVQRYQCKSCGVKFVSTTNTVFSHTHKDADTWRKFIEMTISGASIRDCAEECGLCIQTAFNWRHKVLNAFVVNQEAIKMYGNIEVDEMLLALSYKGNHVQGGFGARKVTPGVINDMPRKSYKRGSDNKSKSSKDKACIFCMVEDGNKTFYAAVPGVGFMTEPMLDATVGKHVNKEKAMVLADSYKTTRKYLESKGYKHTILLSNTTNNLNGHKPEIKGELHIQHVNSMHQHIRTFLRPYCGVSSKYLENYMALFTWLKNISASKQRKTAKKISVIRAATPDCYITCKHVYNRPAVPKCA